jgi:hypothetical protein
MKKTPCFMVLFLLLSFTVGLQAGTKYLVTATLPKLEEGERIIQFGVTTKSARIAQMPNTPLGWDLRLLNDPSWNIEMSGTLLVASAALSEAYFQNFLVIEEIERTEGLKLPPLDIQVEIVTSKDYSTEFRRLVLHTKDLHLKALS